MPSKASATTSASKCRPSPATSTCRQSIAAAMAVSIDSVVVMGASMPELPPAREQRERHERKPGGAGTDDGKAQPGRRVGKAEEAVAEAVDHIKERIEMRHRLPERRKRPDRVEHPGQEREGGEYEILGCGAPVRTAGPEAGGQARPAPARAAAHGQTRP